MGQKFLQANYDSARDLIENIFEEMDNDVLINGNTKLKYFDDDNLRITKGNFGILLRIWLSINKYNMHKKLSKLLF